MRTVSDALNSTPELQTTFYDDFTDLDVTNRWTDVSGDSGAAPTLATDGESAIIFTTGGTDNNECYLTSKMVFDLTVGCQTVIEGAMKWTEAATDDANIIFGLMSGAGANALLDTGGGPAASYSGAVFFKVDGGTKWNVESSIAGAQTTAETERTASGISGWQILRIQFDPISAAECEVTFHVGQEGGTYFKQVVDSNYLPIKHTIVTSSFAAANVVIGAKAGDTNSETPRCDWVRVRQAK